MSKHLLTATAAHYVYLHSVSCAMTEPVRISPDRDNFPLTQDCVIEAGVYQITDEDGNGALHILSDGITITFAEGAVLEGSTRGQTPNAFVGIGIRLDGHSNVTIRHAKVRGFKTGAYLSGSDGLTVEDSDFSGNFRQHLKSTPEAEVGSDWLFPHNNENNEWLNDYGAAVYIESSDRITVRRNRVREGQNGIIIDDVNDSVIYDNDCSFISGWGLAMWRSNRNVITRNAFDFCVRGYSHGVYNRGQDSAGILCFEQNSNNLIAENSATHGGDGFFGFAGVQALASRERLGNNNNLLINNDFSYAPAHGIEMTFSFDNRFIGNRLVENAICGVWGGYSQDTTIALNTFEGNGEMAYGAERGGINIEHGFGNRIETNTFRNNKCGIHLWWDNDENLLREPWCAANEKGSAQNFIANNTFEGDQIALQVRQTRDTTYVLNRVSNVAKEIESDSDSNLITDVALPAVVFAAPEFEAIGDARPVGARPHLAGRQNIVMTEWGPWDHEAPLLVRRKRGSNGDIYELLGADQLTSSKDFQALPMPGERGTSETLHGLCVFWDLESADVTANEQMENRRRLISIVAPDEPGVYPYRLRLSAGNLDQTLADTIIRTTWDVTFFPWTVDPREDEAGWRNQSLGKSALSTSLAEVDFPFAGGGPCDLPSLECVGDVGLPRDHFGTIARTRLNIPAGTWRVTTTSDDGVRVSVNGVRVIDNWTWHAPTRDNGTFTQTQPGPAEILIEHFEIDGYATLQFEIKRESE